MIVDAFIFNNEFKQLEIRLHELEGTVDCHVLVESNLTFSGHPKPLWFALSRLRYKHFLDRIIHVTVKDMPAGPDRWQRERWQRNAILRGLHTVKADDLILISDADEIPMPWGIRKAQEVEMPTAFGMKTYYYHLCGRSQQSLTGTVAARARDLGQPHNLRDQAQRGPWQGMYLQDACWHYSFMGGAEQIEQKIHSFAHGELDTDYFTNPLGIERRIAGLQDPFERQQFPIVYEALNGQHPQYVQQNLDKFADWLPSQEKRRDQRSIDL